MSFTSSWKGIRLNRYGYSTMLSETTAVQQNQQRCADVAQATGQATACTAQGSATSNVATRQRGQADTIIEALYTIQAREQLFPAATADKPQVVVVGVSGGADSVCLLQLLHHLAPVWHLDLHVAHLDHALRADSAADAAFVQELATAWQLPFHLERLVPGALAAADGSVETAARQARQRYLATLAQSLTPTDQQPIVALAHHADDQAETVLHHLVRGSGLQGLGGMRPSTAYTLRSTVAEKRATVIQFVRPLLYVRRATILQHLRQHKLTWREDETNTDQRYTRNYLRHTVLPALTTVNPAAVEAIRRLATIAADEMARLANYDRQLLASLQWPKRMMSAPTGPAATGTGPDIGPDIGPGIGPGIGPDIGLVADVAGQLVLDLTHLRTLPVATQRALLRQAVALVAPSLGDLRFDHLTTLCAAIAEAASGGPHPLVADLQWSVAGATANRPALLSIHRQAVLPFAAGEPLLSAGAMIALPAVALGATARLALTNGWQLTITRLARRELPLDWAQRGQPWRAFLDSATIGQPLLTTSTTGQHFAPLGLAGQHKALGDLFTDQKIPVALRPQWPLLLDAATQEILWVCGVQLGHRARVTAATAQVLSLRFDQG